MGAVDRRRADDPGRAGQCLEHLKPNALPAPAVEAVIDRRVRPVFRRAIAPPRTRTQHLHDAADHTAIVHTARTSAPARQQGFKTLPVRLA